MSAFPEIHPVRAYNKYFVEQTGLKKRWIYASPKEMCLGSNGIMHFGNGKGLYENVGVAVGDQCGSFWASISFPSSADTGSTTCREGKNSPVAHSSLFRDFLHLGFLWFFNFLPAFLVGLKQLVPMDHVWFLHFSHGQTQGYCRLSLRTARLRAPPRSYRLQTQEVCLPGGGGGSRERLPMNY